MPTIVLNELPWRPAQQTLLPLAEAAQPITSRLGERWPMSIFEHVRKALITLLQAERIEFEPAPRELARGLVSGNIPRVEVRAAGVPIEDTEVKLSQLHIVATDLKINLTLRGPIIDVGAARFTAHLTSEQLTELIPLPLGVDRLTVTPRGFTFNTVTGIKIYTSVTLKGSKIVVSPSTPAKVPLLDLIGIDIDIPQLPVSSGLEQLTRFGLAFDLPELPANGVITDLALHDGYAEIGGTLDLTPPPLRPVREIDTPDAEDPPATGTV